LFDKTETTSPTVANDSLMYSILIDAKERRDVATADVVGAYLNADMEDFTLMKLTGEAVDIMVTVDKLYKPYVTTKKGKPVLYLQLKKALYGCVKSALLWYELFANTLKDMGFELNPYDPCVANKDIKGTQCTILWYVDDNKISHVNPDVVTEIILQIEKRLGKMTVTRGGEHTFLGMNFTFNGDDTVSISMKTYLQEAIGESKMRIHRSAASPAKKELFETNDDLPVLQRDEFETFHSVVAKLLYVSIRARPDVLLAVSFLCTQVSKPNKEDQEKLNRVLEYLKGTLDLVLTLGADDLNSLRTWVDTSYAVHPDMKSHTGGMISMGTGALVCKSSKPKLNTKSSTEAELVGASDYIQNTIWSKLFLEAQGYPIRSNVFEQDNISAIRLEKNGRVTAGKQSRHIDIRYFFMKDRIKSEGIEIRHCPTEEMLADFLTKSLQGALFRKFRDVLLGYEHTSSLNDYMKRALDSEERVEEKYSYSTKLKKNETGQNPIVRGSMVSSTDEKRKKDEERTTSTTEQGWSLVVRKGKIPLTRILK
jgi:Reverse transcriptase (RNA-dependent DNA polymerase)